MGGNFSPNERGEVNVAIRIRSLQILKRRDIIMKNGRVVFIVMGIALFMLVSAPYASAQGVWFKGKASMKGYKVSDTGAIEGKAGGGITFYVNIADDTLNSQYLVTTCIEDPDLNDVWHLGVTTGISYLTVYGDPNTAMIWDFADDSGMIFYHNVYAYPMFYVKMNGSLASANFKSFSCETWDNSSSSNFKLGSCSISFKNVDATKVPAGCAIP